MVPCSGFRLPSPPRARICAGVMALGLVMLSASAGAALYKWIDASGRTVYSDTPPIGDMKTERVNVPASANPNAAKDMVNQEAEFQKRQKQRTEDAKKAEKARADDARKQDACARLKSHSKALGQTGVLHYRFNDKGERVVLDAAALQAERDRAEAALRDHKCES